MKRSTKQNGYVYRRGNWWMVRYRETLIENGQLVRRQTAKQVEQVADEDKRLKRPPQAIIDKAEAMLKPLNDGMYTPESGELLAAYVENKFFPDHERLIRASTLTGYKRRWNFVKPYCEDKRLRNFKTVDGQRVLNEIARKNPHLLRSTLVHFKTLLSAFFTHAISQGILDGEVTISGTRKTVFGNPMRAVRVPRAPEGEDTYAYTNDEVNQMLLYLPRPASVIVAVAAWAGLRRSELAGSLWENYTSAELSVRRSVWEGHIDEPKTRKSKASVPVIPRLRSVLDLYRFECGNPISGPMFKSERGTPLNLNNVLNRMILPALNRCEVCHKPERNHTDEDHEYRRDSSRPEWHGWHGFRRGLATNLKQLGVDDHVIQRILRHSHVSVTQACYIKTVPQQAIDAMNRLEKSYCAPSVHHSDSPKPSKLLN